jgi:hypothetical protein
MKNTLAFLTLALLVLCPSGNAWALKTEHVGNDAIAEANYREWPGIMPLVNHPSRVYEVWVNGNEYLYYRGDTAALNDALRKFAASTADAHEVLLQPGPGETNSHNPPIPYNWSLHVVGGIIGADLPKRDQGGKIWSRWATMTVCVGGDIDLRKIEIPKGVSILDLGDRGRRYREALASKDSTVRGWGAGELAHLDPYDADNLAAIVKLLKDDDDWVRRNAVGALATFGKKAESLLPTLREMRSTGDQHFQEQVDVTIKEIQQAKDAATVELSHRAILKEIRDFRDSRKP